MNPFNDVVVLGVASRETMGDVIGLSLDSPSDDCTRVKADPQC